MSWAAHVTIQDLGSIGELIAAAATIATLFYLALQIRASTNVARSDANQSVIGSAMTSNLALAQDPALAELLLNGLRKYPELEPGEATRFEFLMACILAPHIAAHNDFQLGLTSDQDIDYVRAGVRRFLSTPGGGRWFEDHAKDLPRHYVDFASKTLKQGGDPRSTQTGAAAQQGDEADVE